jgi:pimeloyl-ACP methyl ester carboxylesterase
MEDLLLLYKNSRVHYQRFGTGNKTALCFHGYGQDIASFSFLEKYAGNDYRFYAIDLPFHGSSESNNGLNFAITDLLNILQEIPGLMDQQITLIGFSLGGRVALSLYEIIPDRIEKLILMAPDGLKVNFWYWLTTQTSLGNKLFAFTMKHPGWFFAFLKLINKLGLVNSSIFKFVNYYIGNKEVRKQLYDRWTAFRKLKPSIAKIKSEIRRHRTSVQLFYGKYDRIILPSRGKKFQKGIENYCSLKIIHSGHQVLHENHIKEILPALLTTPGND